MQLEQFHTPAGFEALKPDWNRLLHTSQSNTVFSTWEWQTVWWRHLGAGQPWLLAARDAAGALRAIFPCHVAPAADGERQVRLVGCAEVADYLDLIVAAGQEQAALDAFLGALAAPDAPAWDSVELCNIHQDSPTARLLPDLARAAGFAVHVYKEEVCPLIALPSSFDAYLLSIDKKQRHEIKRKQRRIETEAQLAWYVVDQRHDLQREIAAFLELHRLSRPDKHSFMDPKMAAFFLDMAGAMHAAGWLQLLHMSLDDRPVAALLSFDYGNAISLYNSGFEPAGPYAFLSPGNVLIAIAIQHAIELGRGVFDFLRGSEEYKYRFGAHDVEIFRIQLRRGA